MTGKHNHKFGNILGAGRAEIDHHMLENAFVETADYRALVSTSDYNFVVGRRGTGKSALFFKLQETFTKQSQLWSANKPEEYETLELRHILTQLAPEYREARAVARLAWKCDILLSLANLKYYKNQRAPALLFLADYIREHSDLFATAGPRRCAAIVRRFAKQEKSELSLPAAIATGLQINRLQDAIASALTETNRTAVLFWDGLDEGWAPDQAATAVLGGLAAAVSDLAEAQTGIHCILFVRDNMFRALAHFDKDFSRNIESNTLRLQWDAASLLHLVANRLRVVLDMKDVENDVRVWNRFVQRGLQGREGFERCLQHTLYRPRDILSLLNRAFVDVSRQGRDHLVDEDMETTAVGISTDRLEDLLKEYEGVLPGLKSFVRLFEGRPAIDSFSCVREQLDQAAQNTKYEDMSERDFAIFETGAEIFNALYGVGFIGIHDPSTGAYTYCHDGSSFGMPTMREDRKTAIHPCYWRALGAIPEEGADRILVQVDDENEGGIAANRGDRESVRDLRTARLGQLVSELSDIPTGIDGSRAFEDWVFRVLRMLFSGRLSNFELKPNRLAVQQRDIVASNPGHDGFWRRVLDDYRSRQVLFEVKNYEALKAEDYRQVLSYESGPYGSFGLLVYRSENEGLTEHERAWLSEVWHEHRRLIFTIPVTLLRRSVWRVRNVRKYDYAEAAFQKRLDRFQRNYLAIRHS